MIWGVFYRRFSPSPVPQKVESVVSVIRYDAVRINWTNPAGVFSYIVNVRQYSSNGQGKIKVDPLDEFPEEIDASPLQFDVRNLGETQASPKMLFVIPAPLLFSSYLRLLLPLPFTFPVLYSSPAALVPYDVQLVARNLGGCGPLKTSDPFFTEEGSTYDNIAFPPPRLHTSLSFLTPPPSPSPHP